MREGLLAALDAIEAAIGEIKVHTIGYCVGGTLLSITLAYMAAKNDTRVASATLFAAQVDFTHAGDLKVFVDEEQLDALEKRMTERGYLEGKKMANAFNMLRSNDLIWPYIINNYLRGKAPMPFDLLYWNSDATRMPAANHAFYLRQCYLNNSLSKGKMTIGNVQVDLKTVKVPLYNLATREDHIAPAKSAFLGSKFFGGPVKFVLSGSGHIAGVVNPPNKGKYQYWTGGKPGSGSLEALAKKSHGASGLVVAGLDRMDQVARRHAGPAARTGRRQAEADRGRAGTLCEGPQLGVDFPEAQPARAGPFLGRSCMAIESDTSRREFLGALSAGVAAAGSLAASSESTAQGAAPLKIVDFHNHYIPPSWTLTNLANVPPAARPAVEALNRNLQSQDALLSSVKSQALPRA